MRMVLMKVVFTVVAEAVPRCCSLLVGPWSVYEWFHTVTGGDNATA